MIRFLVLFFIAVIVIFAVDNYKKSKKETEEALKFVEDKKKRADARGAEYSVFLTHVMGLPVADGVDVEFFLLPYTLEFVTGGAEIAIERDRITDVSIKIETEIQTHYSRSMGKAIAGGMVFGPVGAIIGGREKKKETAEVSHYLIFSYTKEESIDYIVFDVTSYRYMVEPLLNFFEGTDKKRISL